MKTIFKKKNLAKWIILGVVFIIDIVYLISVYGRRILFVDLDEGKTLGNATLYESLGNLYTSSEKWLIFSILLLIVGVMVMAVSKKIEIKDIFNHLFLQC